MRKSIYIMLKRMHILCVFFAVPAFGIAQILPKDGSRLSFRLVGFSFPEEKGVKEYALEIAEGHFTDAETFKKNVCIRRTTSKTETIIELPKFGGVYTWHVNTKSESGKLHHFSTLADNRVDTTKYRLRITQPSAMYPEKYIMLDEGGLFYDIKGVPVAFLPERGGVSSHLRAFSTTKDSTLTFVNTTTNCVYEATLSSRILWQAPKRSHEQGGVADLVYHHDFVKMPNGHYMTMIMEFASTKQVVTPDTSYILVAKNKDDSGYTHGLYNALIEYDKDGNIVWRWSDIDHLIGSDYDYYTWPELPQPLPRSPLVIRGPAINPELFRANGDRVPAAPISDTLQGPLPGRFDPHANAFFYDEKSDALYVSYRNINRLIKIDHSTRKTIAIYGHNFKPGAKSVGGDIFCNPHAVRLSKDRRIYFFNNNSCLGCDSLPRLIVLREPTKKGMEIAVEWEYTCDIDSGFQKKFPSGGSVIELSDGSFFVCMGSTYSKLFIVNRAKQQQWSAFPEFLHPTDNAWRVSTQYRANILERKELEALIWRAEQEQDHMPMR